MMELRVPRLTGLRVHFGVMTVVVLFIQLLQLRVDGQSVNIVPDFWSLGRSTGFPDCWIIDSQKEYDNSDPALPISQALSRFDRRTVDRSVVSGSAISGAVRGNGRRRDAHHLVWRERRHSKELQRGSKTLFCKDAALGATRKHDVNCEEPGAASASSPLDLCQQLLRTVVCAPAHRRSVHQQRLASDSVMALQKLHCLRDMRRVEVPGAVAMHPRHHHVVRRSSSPILIEQGSAGISLAPLITATVSEDINTGAFVTHVYATSAAAAAAAPLQYRIVSGNGGGHFAVNVSGDVYVAQPLNYEDTRQYSLVVGVYTSAAPTQIATTTVIVYIRDRNEFTPVFIYPMGMSHYQATLTSSNRKPGALPSTQPVLQVKASDQDQLSTLRFSITGGNYLEHFQIGLDGMVSTTTRFSGSQARRYELTVTVSDSLANPRLNTARLQITVLANPDETVLFIPGYYSAGIAERSPAVAQLLQVQAVNGVLRHSMDYKYAILSGNADNKFSLDPTTGWLGTKSMLDREQQETYQLTVRASNGTASNTTTITVTVTDVNDNPSLNGGHRSFVVHNYNHTLKAGTLGRVHVNDADSSRATFKCTTLSSDNAALLSINQSTCEVSLLQNNPAAGTVRVTVSVTDGIQPAVNTTVQLHIISAPLLALTHSLSFSVAGYADRLLQSAKIAGIMNAIRLVTGAGITDIYLLGVYNSYFPGNTDISFAISTGHSSYLSKEQLIASLSRNRSALETQLGTVMSHLPLDPCTSAPCRNFATCQPRAVLTASQLAPVSSDMEVLFSVPLERSYTCVCPPGTTGRHCELSLDVCYSQPCPSGAACTVSPADAQLFECTGSTASGSSGGVSGSRLNASASCKCLNNGSCAGNSGIEQLGTMSCTCPDLYYGLDCGQAKVSNVTDACRARPCANGGTCTSGRNSFTCTCSTGFQGDRCQTAVLTLTTACASNPCYHGSSCTPDSSAVLSYTCQCSAGYTGDQCTWPVRACSSQPCRNAARCYDLDAAGEYVCDCLPGFHGDTCERVIDPCHSSPCLNEGLCLGTGHGFACSCAGIFYGDTCQHSTFPNLCAVATCRNSANCTQSSTSSSCQCPPQHQGRTCSNTAAAGAGPCASNPCQHGSTCQDLTASGAQGGRSVFACICAAGFTGRLCSENIDECQSNPCSGYSTCHDAVNGYLCSCPPGLHGYHCTEPCPAGTTGPDCTLPMYSCLPGNCLNGGSCVEDATVERGYRCQCGERYAGDRCQLAPSCALLPCKNGGTCNTNADGVGYWCMCPLQYQGKLCELTTISSSGAGFRGLPGQPLGARDLITLHFKTTTENGLLYYGRQLVTNSTNSFIAIEISSGRLQAVVQYSAGRAVRLAVTRQVVDGQWHNVSLYHNSQYARLSLDGGSLVPQTFASGLTTGTSGYLSLGLPLYLSGTDRLTTTANTPALNVGFRGCLGNLYINSKLVDLADMLVNRDTAAGCAQTHTQTRCQSNTCPLAAQCVSFSNGFKCSCPQGTTGQECKKEPASVTLSATGYIQYKLSAVYPTLTSLIGSAIQQRAGPSPNTLVQLQVRPSSNQPKAVSQVLWYMQDVNNASVYESLIMSAGQLMYITTVGGVLDTLSITLMPWDSSTTQWHSITVNRHDHIVILSANKQTTTGYLNKQTTMGYLNNSGDTWIEVDRSNVFAGGLPPSIQLPAVGKTSGFVGCIRDIRFNTNLLPVQGSNDIAEVQSSSTELGQPCETATAACTPACQLPFECNARSKVCVCPEGQTCASATATPAPMEEDGAGVLIIVYIALPIVIALAVLAMALACWRRTSSEDAAIKRALELESPSSTCNTGKTTMVFTNKDPRSPDNVLTYCEEGGGEIKDVQFDIDVLLREIRRPDSSLSQSSVEVYPQTSTAMTSVCNTANQTACPTPKPRHPSNPNIFLASYTNSSHSTRPGSKASSTTKLNMDSPDSRGATRPNSRGNRNERIRAAERTRPSGHSTAQTSARPSVPGSRKMSPHDSGQSTPAFYHSTPSLACMPFTPTQPHNTDRGNIRQTKRHSPQGSSSRDSPSRSPPQAVRQAPQGIEANDPATAAPTTATAAAAIHVQTSRQTNARPASANTAPNTAPTSDRHQQQRLQERLQRNMARNTRHQAAVMAEGTDRPHHYDTELEPEHYAERLGEDLCPGESGPRHIDDPRSMGQDFAHISQFFDYDNDSNSNASTQHDRHRNERSAL